MYSNATAVMKLESSVSTPFPCRRGVRQGCNLSPLLFSLFISDLEDTLNPSGAEGVDLGNAKLRLLLFADDLVIVAHSPEDLQTSLDELSEYCAKWDLLTNSSKTEVIATPFARATPCISAEQRSSGSSVYLQVLGCHHQYERLLKTSHNNSDSPS